MGRMREERARATARSAVKGGMETLGLESVKARVDFRLEGTEVLASGTRDCRGNGIGVFEGVVVILEVGGIFADGAEEEGNLEAVGFEILYGWEEFEIEGEVGDAFRLSHVDNDLDL